MHTKVNLIHGLMDERTTKEGQMSIILLDVLQVVMNFICTIEMKATNLRCCLENDRCITNLNKSSTIYTRLVAHIYTKTNFDLPQRWQCASSPLNDSCYAVTCKTKKKRTHIQETPAVILKTWCLLNILFCNQGSQCFLEIFANHLNM